MKKIGIIGGVGPESTIEYYKQLIKRYREKCLTNDYPSLLINSINMSEMLKYVFEKKFPELVVFLLKEIEVLKKGGVEIVAIASNTPHIIFDELEKKAGIRLISIVKETCKYIKIKGISKVGLFGTKSTMTAGFYQNTGLKYGIEIIAPNVKEQEYIHKKYMSELVNGIITDETKQRIIEIAGNLKVKTGINGLILGGTELPLIISQGDFENIEIFDTTKIHVESILDHALES